jgi:O-antigen ligase
VIRYPALPLALLAIATFVWFAAANGGYDPTTWYPGALVVLALVTIGALTLPRAAAGAPRLVLVAVLALLAYAVWSYLSIGWAGQKGEAWDGANRTLLYALAFALFALWRPRARPAVVLLVAYSLAVTVLGLVELLRATGAADPRDFFSQGRFASPAGYMNANVALWFTALWPCLVLGARRELAPLLRGLLVFAGVVLCGLAVLGQSRGWLFTAPVAGLAIVAFTPSRVRTVLTLGLVLAATGAVAGKLLEVYRSAGERGFPDAVSGAAGALLAAAAVAGVVAVLAALPDRRARPSRAQERRIAWAAGALAVVTVAIGLGAFVSARGSPFTAASKAWHEFKTEPSPYGGESRFTGSLGTHRFDFWRVAWDRFESAPLAGIGADNFQQDYLARRRSDNAPRYPHSVEIRTLSQTGLAGAALLLLGVGAGLAAALLAIRRRSGIGSAAAAAGAASFAYWLIHGSVDWFWEFPALGAPAFALLGLAAGLLPRPAALPAASPRGPGRSVAWRRMAPAALVAMLALAAAVSLGGPWLSAVEQNSAVATWTTDPAAAFDDLDSAASLNPLSATPKLLGGSIALRLGRRAQAERLFRAALARDPRDAYAHLELGALLAGRGRRAEAIAALTRATTLDPRDDLAAATLRRVRRGRRVDIESVNRTMARRAEEAGR